MVQIREIPVTTTSEYTFTAMVRKNNQNASRVITLPSHVWHGLGIQKDDILRVKIRDEIFLVFAHAVSQRALGFTIPRPVHTFLNLQIGESVVVTIFGE